MPKYNKNKDPLGYLLNGQTHLVAIVDEKPLQSLGGVAPFEYCDGVSSLNAGSLFALPNTRVLATT